MEEKGSRTTSPKILPGDTRGGSRSQRFSQHEDFQTFSFWSALAGIQDPVSGIRVQSTVWVSSRFLGQETQLVDDRFP